MSADRTAGNRALHLRKGTAVGAVLVLLLTVLAPQQTRIAEAAPEQTAGVTLEITSNRGMVGYTYVNNGQYDETNRLDDAGQMRYGLIEGKTPYSGAPEQSSTYQQFWVTGDQQAQNLWSYAARGRPDGGTLGTYIQANNQSAIGFQANDLTTVTANTPFLIGTMRHNNNPIFTNYKWLHSQLYLDFNGVQEAFPFAQEETPTTPSAWSWPARVGITPMSASRGTAGEESARVIPG